MHPATHAPDPRLTGDNRPSPEEISEHLQRLLASPTFHGSKRCQQFLEYVCEKALAGETGALKERCLAIDVFGRQPGATQGEDTIVRVSAREVRKRLVQYYATADGATAPIVIELPSGSYAPEFHYSALAKLKAETHKPETPSDFELAPEEPVPLRPPATRVLSRWIAIGSCIVLAGASAFAMWKVEDSRTAPFRAFWAPVFHNSEPLLIGVGHPLVYQPSHRASVKSEHRQPPTPFPVQRPLNLAPDELNGSDMVPSPNQFVGFGDMIAANEISQMLAHRSRDVRIMLASSIPFADLKQSQTYLIGSLTNHWTMELGQSWRFRFAWTKDLQPEFVDTLPGARREWAIASRDDGSTPEDYSMICRIPNSPTGMLLIVSAGIKQFGTEAAGRILADPKELSTILNTLPKGWENRNLQLILHMKVIGNTPAKAEVVASHVW
jgi:hypothetical protein